VASQTVAIDVLQGPTEATSQANQNSVATTAEEEAEKEVPTKQNQQFRFIKSEANFKSIEKKTFFKTPLFWCLLLLPFIAIPLVILISKRSAALAGDHT